MARPRKFPLVIHVTSEKDDDTNWLMVRDGGVFDIEENGKEVAVYKLASIGKANIVKKFVEAKKVK